MKKIIMIFAGIISLLSCSKDDQGSEISKNSGCRITEVNGWQGGTHRINFEYDEQGRTNKIVENFSERVGYIHQTTFQFIYSTDNIQISQQVDLSYGTPTIPRTEETYFLENGKITKSTEGYWVKYYEYNDDGYLSSIKVVIDHKEHYTKISYENGNLYSIKYSDYPWVDDYLVTYNTLERLSYAEFIGIDHSFGEWFFENIGESALYEHGFFGKKIKNQIKSIKYNNSEEVFTYKNDNNGKPISFSTNSNPTTFYNFERTCN